MSRSSPRAARARRDGADPEDERTDARPAPADAFVAVLERHGRFLTAESLFPPARGRAGPGEGARETRRARPTRVTLGPARANGGRVRADAGDMVLMHASRRGGTAQVLRRLGRPDVAREVIEALLLDRGLSRGFVEEVEREARAAGARVRAAPGDRRDLRELATFTIDPASARDFDDAISAQELDGGAVRVWVHIADVAAHVREGSALDREARRRATSVYAPGAVEPMLPHALSSDACSLVPNEERMTVTVELELREARVERAAFYRSVIRSDARLDYEQVDRMFAGGQSSSAPWGRALAAARRAAQALQRERERVGGLAIDSQEPEFEFDERGNVTAIHSRVQTESHRLIEHLMIAANEAVARLLEQRGVPCLYRVHERPEPERVRRLVDQLASLEVPTPPLPERMSSTQAAQLVGEISVLVERHVQRTGHGRQGLGALVLRSLMQAYYSPKNLGHAGLRSQCYCHFTSPIRRYPDLVCHRALLSAVGGGERAPRAGEMTELGVWTSERERDAMTIERDCDDIARCFALARVLRERGFEQVFAGEVTGLISAGAFVAFGLPDEGDGEDVGEGEGALGAWGASAPATQYEGMLPVRLLRAPDASAKAPAGCMRAGARKHGRQPRGGARREEEARRGEREWWELNEEGTILHGERTGATLRLGEAVRVRVDGVDAIRGRVDLTRVSI